MSIPPLVLWRPLAVLAGAIALFPASSRAYDPDLRLSLGGGVRASFSSTERERHGTESIASLGVAGAISTGDVWIYIDVSRGAASGQPYGYDPTFVPKETKYVWYPIAVGFRANTVPAEKRRAFALYLGAAGIVAPLSIDPPFSPKQSSSVYGLALEFRPELNLENGWGFWVRDRLCVLSENQFSRSDVPELSLSGNGVEIGISRGFGGRKEGSR